MVYLSGVSNDEDIQLQATGITATQILSHSKWYVSGVCKLTSAVYNEFI